MHRTSATMLSPRLSPVSDRREVRPPSRVAALHLAAGTGATAGPYHLAAHQGYGKLVGNAIRQWKFGQNADNV